MTEFVLLLLLFLVVATIVSAGMIGVGRLLGPQRSGAVKEMPYESGMDPIHDARRRFDVRFHLVAIAFLVFDVELLFLYPWAVASRYLPQNAAAELAVNEEAAATAANAADFAGEGVERIVVFGGVMFFLTLVGMGLVYEWRRGVLRWR